MKKKWLFFLTFAMISGLFMAFKSNEKHLAKNRQIKLTFEKLIQEHQQFIQHAYSGQSSGLVSAAYTAADKDFFMYTGFLQDANIQNFFHSVEDDMSQSGHAGYTMMSYTSFISMGGQNHAIQYTYQSNGNNITFVKQTNENGQLLKSVYHYDIKSQSLKADDYRQNRVIQEKVYSI